MIVDLKEKQPVGMMPGGVHMSVSWRDLILALKKSGLLSKDEIITHAGSDLTGVTFRIEHI